MNHSDLVLYSTDDGRDRIEVRLQGETVWLSQAAMANLFETTKQNISLHLKNIYAEGELAEEATVKDYLTVRHEGAREEQRAVVHYNLEAIIADGADAGQPNMGLKSWKGAKVRRGDVTVAKNYLNEDEVSSLNRIVTMYLDFAEDQAKRRRQIFQRDWREKLDAFLQLNEREVLQDAGRSPRRLPTSWRSQSTMCFRQTG